jgi:hypothetical protein
MRPAVRASRRRGDARPYILSAIALMVGLGLFLTFVIRYSLRLAPELNREAKPVVDQFYLCSQRHDFAGAREMFGPGLKDNISTADLAKRWKKFEAQHGPLTSWKPAAGQPGAVNLFPKSVDFDHLVLGKKGDGTRIFIRVVPYGKEWRIEKLSLFS